MSAAGQIWLTRPHQDSQRMADLLALEHIPSIVAPLTRIEHQPVEWPAQKPTALLITSRHAVEAAGTMPQAWRDLPVYCSGAATAQAMQQQGFLHCMHQEKGIVPMLPVLRHELAAGAHLLYPCGGDIKIDLEPLLAPQEIKVERVLAYHAIALPSLADGVVSGLRAGTIQGVIFCSPRAVLVAQELLTEAGLLETLHEVDIYCLSLDIAAIAGGLGGRSLHACHVPSYDAMMELLSTHAIRAGL